MKRTLAEVGRGLCKQTLDSATQSNGLSYTEEIEGEREASSD